MQQQINELFNNTSKDVTVGPNNTTNKQIQRPRYNNNSRNLPITVPLLLKSRINQASKLFVSFFS